MKRSCSLAIAVFFMCVSTNAQYKTVPFNYERTYFNEGNPLPAEDKFLINGNVPPNIDLVEIEVFPNSNTTKTRSYSALWKRNPLLQTSQFIVPFNYPLRGNQSYTFVVNYYQKSDAAQQIALSNQLSGALDAYVNQSVEVGRSDISLRTHPRQMMNNMNDIVEQGMAFYKNRIDYEFPGFSDIVRDKIYQIKDLRLKNAKYNIFKKKESQPAGNQYAQEQLTALKQLIKKELNNFINTDLYRLADTKKITDYPTEKVKTLIAINVGYAGIYKNRGFGEFNVGGVPFAGISFPLGRKAFSSPFWSHSSISTGVLLQNVKFSDETVATGPIINLPLYLAYGYRILPFVRLNAGATVLQSEGVKNEISNFSKDKLFVRPFVGLSVEFNLWLGLNK